MANDERDRKFEKALTSRLRSGARDSVAQDSACPDAEILAAYHERSLSPEELTSSKNHIAGCARCQEVLAQLEITDGIEVAAGQELAEITLVGASAANPPTAEKILTMTAAPAQTRAAATPPQSEHLAIATLRHRKTPWLWIAPAGAIAAALLVSIALYEKSAIHSPKPNQPEIALNRAPEPAPTSATRAESPTKIAPALPEDKKIEPTLRQHVSSKPAYSAGAFSTLPPKPATKKADVAQAEPLTLSADAMREDRSLERGLVTGGQKQEDAPGPPSQSSNSMGRGAAVGALTAKRAKAATPSPANVPGPAPPPTQQSQQQQQSDQSASAITETVEVTAGASSGYSMASRIDAVRNLSKINAPGGHIIWMIGPAGFVQRSEDAGKSWKLQKSGVNSDLRAGSSPNPKICWVVGSAGVVLRTTDGGKNWEKLSSPTGSDLVSVNAYDDLHATIADASNKISFVTNDGGITWTSVALE